MQNEILVSINCITYNHEDYIADAIEGFLMQKTNFKYEIIIHDDASSDRTADIIRKYEKMYPDTIRPIYQTENQYSQGVRVELINMQKARGNYVALCEGDDYWTDPYKLQKQVDIMEKNPEYSICVHSAQAIDAETGRTEFLVRPSKESRVFNVEEVIRGGGGLFATNSMLFKKDLIKNLPQFYYNAPVADYPLMIYLALKGRVFYLDDVMSVYRSNVKNSWTVRECLSLDKRIKNLQKTVKMLEEVNLYTNYKYNEVIDRTKRGHEISILVAQGKVKEVKNSKYHEIYSNLGIKKKIYLYLNFLSPSLTNFLVKIIWRKFRRWIMN